jgi:hypothetical protein
MLYWIILLVFGVPLIGFILKSIRSSKARNDRLLEIQERLSEKRQQEIDAKLSAMKEKSRKNRQRQ